MRYFFIDYENVDTEGLNGLTKLTSYDTVFIFYSERHSRMTFGLHRRIEEAGKHGVHFKYRKVKRPDLSEAQVLDQELMGEVSHIILNSANNFENDYYIISKDTDYDNFINAWRKQGYNLSRILTISEGNIKKQGYTSNPILTIPEENVKKQKYLEHIIRARLVNDKNGKSFPLTQEEITKIANFIILSNNKTELNRHLQTMFSSQDVKYIFTRLKDITRDM